MKKLTKINTSFRTAAYGGWQFGAGRSEGSRGGRTAGQASIEGEGVPPRYEKLAPARETVRRNLGIWIAAMAGVAMLSGACCLRPGTEDAGPSASSGTSGTTQTSGSTTMSTSSGSTSGGTGSPTASGDGGLGACDWPGIDGVAHGLAFCGGIGGCVGGAAYCEQVICPACTFADGDTLVGTTCYGADCPGGSRDSATFQCWLDAGPKVLSPSCAAALTSLAERFLDGG